MALKCQSYNCIYNDKDGDCFAQNIDVIGKNAKHPNGTTCSTFVEENSSYFYEFADELMSEIKLSSNTTNIRCSARNCMYNFDTACTANKVLIDDLDASCETFRT